MQSIEKFQHPIQALWLKGGRVLMVMIPGADFTLGYHHQKPESCQYPGRFNHGIQAKIDTAKNENNRYGKPISRVSEHRIDPTLNSVGDNSGISQECKREPGWQCLPSQAFYCIPQQPPGITHEET